MLLGNRNNSRKRKTDLKTLVEVIFIILDAATLGTIFVFIGHDAGGPFECSTTNHLCPAEIHTTSQCGANNFVNNVTETGNGNLTLTCNPNYSLNFVTFNSHPNCTNCVNGPAALNCTGLTSNPLTMVATESVLVTGQYVFNDLNTTMTGPIGVQIGHSTAVPSTTFSVAPCATSLGVIAQFLALPFQNSNFQVSWSFTLTLTAGTTYYFWVDISMNSAFTGHLKFTQTGAVDFIQAVELR